MLGTSRCLAHVTRPQNLCACQSFDLGFRLSDLYKIFIAAKHISLDLSHQLDWMECVAVNPKTFMEGQLFDPDFVWWFKQDILLFWNNYHTQESWNGRFERDWTLNAIRAYIWHTGFEEYSKHSGGEKADQHKLCKCPLRCSFFN